MPAPFRYLHRPFRQLPVPRFSESHITMSPLPVLLALHNHNRYQILLLHKDFFCHNIFLFSPMFHRFLLLFSLIWRNNIMAGFIFLKIFLTSPYCFLPITCFPHFLCTMHTRLTIPERWKIWESQKKEGHCRNCLMLPASQVPHPATMRKMKM